MKTKEEFQEGLTLEQKRLINNVEPMSDLQNDIIEEDKREAMEEPAFDGLKPKSQKEHLDKIEEAQKERMDGEFCLDVKQYLYHSGATEAAERIHEACEQEQEKIIIEKLVSSYEGKYGSRLYA